MLEFFGRNKKDPYKPSEDKRFEISKDEFSRKRIQALKDIHHNLEQSFNMPISLSIIGSLAKGKELTTETARRADIDVSLDLERVYVFDSDPLAKFIKHMFIEALEARKDELGFKKIPKEHIHIRQLDGSSIPNAVNSYMTPTILNRNVNAEINLASFFTLSIGSVARKYRTQFLLELSEIEDPNKAELIWQTIRRVVEKVERGGNIPDKLKGQYPQTLAEALKFYGVKETDAI